MDVPPPYDFPGVEVNTFLWEPPIAHIQEYCDEYLNIGPENERGYVYKPFPVWPYATLLFLKYPMMFSAARKPFGNETQGEPTFYDQGYVRQIEVFVAVPVMRYGLSPTKFVLNSTLEWILPLVIVQQPTSAIAGREMLGLGKLLADIKIGEGPDPGSFSGSVEMLGWPTEKAGVSQMTMPFLQIDTGPVMPTFRGVPDSASLLSLFRSREASLVLDEVANVGNFIQGSTLGLLPTSMRTVALKQIRDAVSPDRALYQALVTCQSKYTNIKGARFYKESDVTIAFNNMGSFRDILRVFLHSEDNPAELFEFKPKAACCFTADIQFNEMRTIYTFPVDRGPGLQPVPASSNLISRLFRPWAGFFGPGQTGPGQA